MIIRYHRLGQMINSLVLLLLTTFTIVGQNISVDKNAVVHSKLREATINDVDATNPAKAMINISYMDGLGRGVQQLGYQQSPTQKDVINNSFYDALGRNHINYLSTPTSSSNGSFNTNGSSLATSFYGDSYPYSQVSLYENSPLSRPRESVGVGQAWRTSNKKTQVFYEVATTNEVRYYRLQSQDIVYNSFYPNNSITKERVIDEQGNTAITYTDRSGRVVQKSQQDATGMINTVYVYDFLGRLRAVVQPQGYELGQTLTSGTTNWQNWVFFYVYDNKNRLTQKHIPGAGWTNYVYDKADRPVLEQSALQATQSKWSFTKYDLFGRMIIGGELINANTQATLQALFDNVAKPYETWQGTTYSSQSYPITYGGTDEKFWNFYDNYSWAVTQWNFNATIAYNPVNYWSDTKGLQTGSFARSTEDPSKVFHTVLYYDKDGRVIQTYQVHHKGGATPWTKPIVTNYEYNFAGEVVKEKILYQIDGLSNNESVTINEYDYVGRVKKVYHGINTTPTEIVAMAYDEISRLTQKKIKTGTYTLGNGKLLKSKVFLMGALPSGSTLMNDGIRQQNLIPTTEPYTALGGKYVHTGGGGGEQTTTQILSSNVGTANAIVDWVFLELRDASNPAIIRKTRSALLQRDGDIVDVDGVSDVNFGTLAGSSYYVAIKHRNHLGVMTSAAISFANPTTILDFSTQTTSQLYNNSGFDGAEQRFSSTPFCLWAGDANRDNKVKYSGTVNDFAIIVNYIITYPTNTTGATNFALAYGYHPADTNMDGLVKYSGAGNDVGPVFSSILTYPLNTGQVYNYDLMLEQLPASSQVVGETPTTIPALQTIDYTYHVRGGLRGINLDASGNPTPKAADGDLFSYKLDYETAGYWDGNIGKQTWQTTTNNSPVGQRSYTFTYDPASRLKTASYNGINFENFSLPNLNYDKNGNITALQRNGKTGSTYGLIDNLTYAYAGNRLSQVTDGVPSNNTVDLVPRGGGGYTYYADGSLQSDANEQISLITYDTYLKQPSQITLTDGRWIKYFYNGKGGLLKTQYSNGEIWEYIGGLVLKNGQPYQMSSPEGRATFVNNTWQYEYFYTDHLGNTRVAYKANGNQLIKTSETAFDPFGVRLPIGVNNAFQNRYEFLNREKESTFGLNRIN
jgi:hypothetical protein